MPDWEGRGGGTVAPGEEQVGGDGSGAEGGSRGGNKREETGADDALGLGFGLGGYGFVEWHKVGN